MYSTIIFIRSLPPSRIKDFDGSLAQAGGTTNESVGKPYFVEVGCLYAVNQSESCDTLVTSSCGNSPVVSTLVIFNVSVHRIPQLLNMCRGL